MKNKTSHVKKIKKYLHEKKNVLKKTHFFNISIKRVEKNAFSLHIKITKN